MARTFNWFDNKTKDMYYRFGSTAGLLVSSQLGGGLWEEVAGLLNKIAARIIGDTPSVSSPDEARPSKPTAGK